MTDLATRPDAEHEHGSDDAGAPGSGASGSSGTPAYAWAPTEDAPRKRRTGWWIGVPAAATAIALVAASLVLIAPGASVAGVQVGGLTQGAAADAIAAKLAATEVVIEGPAGTISVTGAELGASVDANSAAESAFADNPMWNPAAWYPGSVEAPVSLDPVVAAEALRAAAPGMYADPVDATISFDAATATYVTTPATAGEGIDVTAVQSALQQAFDSGTPSIVVDAPVVPVDAAATTDEATAMAATLNGMLDSAGFYVGSERTVPVDRATVASWLTVSTAETGGFEITADAAAIQPMVDGLAASIDRPKVDATVITDSAGAELSAITPGVTGRALDSTDTIAADYASLLAQGQANFPLTVTETPFATTSLARTIDVDLSSQTTTLYENGQVVRSYSISSGLDGSTPTGSYRVGWKTEMQGMGNPDLSKAPYYYTPNVPWVSYFAGDVAFHGTYWHSNFGTPMSHGCINMTIDAAKFVYDWAPKGTQVTVHY